MNGATVPVVGSTARRPWSLARLLGILLVAVVAPVAAYHVVDPSPGEGTLDATAGGTTSSVSSGSAAGSTHHVVGPSFGSTALVGPPGATESQPADDRPTGSNPTTSATPPSTAPTTRPPDTRPSPSTTEATTDPELLVVKIANRERAGAGCEPLRIDDRLVAAARAHSEDMAAHDYFSHTSRDGRTFDERILDAGYPRPGGENIAMGQPGADEVMAAWMASDGHRANILNCRFTAIGVGLAADKRIWTQDFGY